MGRAAFYPCGGVAANPSERSKTMNTVYTMTVFCDDGRQETYLFTESSVAEQSVRVTWSNGDVSIKRGAIPGLFHVYDRCDMLVAFCRPSHVFDGVVHF